ncbi:MAG TPA: DinB family protein [Trueperaceae bacterium]
MNINQTIEDAWRANARANRVLLEHLTPEMLAAKTPGGGMSIAEQLAHVTGTVVFWGMKLDASMAALAEHFDPDAVAFAVGTDLAGIREIMRQTEQAALTVAQNAKDTGSLPHPSAEAYLMHMMIHDAHHRGQVLLALKSAGYPLPDEDLRWGPWRGE